MKTTVELSLYPLHKKYKHRIVEFIETLQSYDELTVESNGMSTQIFGDYEQVMNVVRDEYKKVLFDEQAMLVMKIGKGVLRYGD